MIFWILTGFVCLFAVLFAGFALGLVFGLTQGLDNDEHQARPEIDMTFGPEDQP